MLIVLAQTKAQLSLCVQKNQMMMTIIIKIKMSGGERKHWVEFVESGAAPIILKRNKHDRKMIFTDDNEILEKL